MGNTLEAQYRQSMKELGIYAEAYEPEIKALAMLERERRRAEKDWRDPKKGDRKFVVTQKNKASVEYQAPSPYYAVVEKLRADILTHRTALGLTPAGLRKIKSRGGVGAPCKSAYTDMLKKITETVTGGDG